MISEVCADVRNYFIKSNNDIHFGDFEISNGEIVLDFLKEGQYFRIVGSTHNDGVYRYPSVDLTDEEFNGSVWAMSVPPSFIALVKEIEEYAKNDAGKPSPYMSESFGGYTYQRFSNGSGGVAGWQTIFSNRLKLYRRLSVL